MSAQAAKGLATTSGSGHGPRSAPQIDRPRLVDLLERGIEHPLTLISAPAGSGKTVLLGAWMASAGQPETIAHVGLTREHHDRRMFWLEVLESAARARPALTGLAVPATSGASPAAFRRALEDLPDPLCLVLDDFHHVGAGEVASDLEWLIEHAPNRLRLVVATRSDPPMRLQRLRITGRLAEIRAEELAFTPDEAAELLAPLALDPTDVEKLWARSEGWAAGLRLAGSEPVSPGTCMCPTITATGPAVVSGP